jgi:DNA-directed RNA polymerase subunit RPC12/RpoP
MRCPKCGSLNVEDYTDEFKMVGYRCLRCGCIWFENEWGF